METVSSANQEWLVFVYPQMMQHEPYVVGAERFLDYLDEFLRSGQPAASEMERKVRRARADGVGG